MSRLQVELVDKISKGYVVYFSDGINVLNGKNIIIPSEVYDYYDSKLDTGDVANYTIHFTKGDKEDINVSLTKYDKYMDVEFEDYSATIKHVNFKKTAKSYTFQTFVDIRTYNDQDEMVDYKYRFLDNYDTRSKAVFFMSKLTYRFTTLYKKWFIGGGVRYDAVKNIEVFHGDTIYEEVYTFDNKNNDGITIYTFSVISVQKR